MAECAWFRSQTAARGWAATLLVLGACVQASTALADRVVLVSGSVLEGKVERDGDKIIVETDSGKVALPADMVKRVEPSHSDVQELEARLAKLAPDDVAGLLTLANYCRDHDMPAREKDVLQRILSVAPDHAEARARLGYVKTPAGWMTQDELMEQRGYVKYQGEWITRDQQRAIESSLLEAHAAEIEREREQARALQAEFDAEQAQDQSWASTPPPPVYPTYWYGTTSYGYGRNYGSYRPYGYSSGYAPEHRFSDTAHSTYRPPPAPRSAPAPTPRPMGDTHGSPGWRPSHSRH